jgi:hypothetical protein
MWLNSFFWFRVALAVSTCLLCTGSAQAVACASDPDCL